MNGILAQTAALAAHAKVRTLDPELGGDDAYWAAHSTFKYVKTLQFVAPKRSFLRTTQAAVATTPQGWMCTLPKAAAINLLTLGNSGPLPPHIASAFVGGTHEGIAVVTDASSGIWMSEWAPSGEQYPQRRIWQVNYTFVQTSWELSDAFSLGQARVRLEKALREITDFAAGDPGLAPWCKTFQEAEEALCAQKPTPRYHPDILPPAGYTLAAHQLLAAAVGGFVFGGMGSWNDGGPTSEEARPQYDRLTADLYAAVTGGLASAVNDGVAR